MGGLFTYKSFTFPFVLCVEQSRDEKYFLLSLLTRNDQFLKKKMVYSGSQQFDFVGVSIDTMGHLKILLVLTWVKGLV